MHPLTIGILAFQGDVIEHIQATKKAAEKLGIPVTIIPVRTKESLENIDALIIPGGESTTLQKLCERENMFAEMKKIQYIFGTCAGAIMLAKTVYNKIKDQKTLALMDMAIDRNAYGRQTESFEKTIQTKMGTIHAVFIRAPKIKSIAKNVSILAKYKDEILACEHKSKNNYYVAACFHPELTTTLFHEYFLQQIQLTQGKESGYTTNTKANALP